MIRQIAILVVFTALITGLPLIGVYLSGRSVSFFFSFPPLTVPTVPKPFSWPIFMGYLILALGILCITGVTARRKLPGYQSGSFRADRSLPWWGWLAVAALIVSWFLAWTRFTWFESLQRHTFIPLWLSYIMVANALCFRQSGKCPLLNKPLFFLALFPVSAAFWWYFEYLNQFVQNWYYTGVDYGPITYSLHATISFSTVLPAVYTTRVWITGMEWFRQRFYWLLPLAQPGSTLLSWVILLISCTGLLGISLWPDELFSMLWTAPLFILTSLQCITGQTCIFSAIPHGDWRPVVSAAIAALICGFLWEMWNYYSLAKWVYSVPYVYRFKIFEMPVLGYMGYLPFGLECLAIVEIFKSLYVNDRKN